MNTRKRKDFVTRLFVSPAPRFVEQLSSLSSIKASKLSDKGILRKRFTLLVTFKIFSY